MTEPGVALAEGRTPAGTRLIGDVARLIIAAAVVMTVSLMTWGLLPLVWGWHPYVVTSGSMAPLIQPGDVVVVSDHDDHASLGPGTVVLIDPAPGARSDSPVTHRIVQSLPDGTYRTRGDANATADSRLIGPDAIRAEARLVVPWIGQPKLMIDEHPLPVAGAAVLLIAGLIILRRRRSDRSGGPDHRLLGVVLMIGLIGVVGWPRAQAAFVGTTSAPPSSFTTGEWPTP